MRILVVEDNEHDFVLVRRSVSSFTDVSVENCVRLKSALDHMWANPVDVVLLDLSLPDSQNLESLITIQAQFPDLPIIIYTGNQMEALALEAVRHGAQDYLLKGKIDGQTLYKSLQYAIERKRLEKRFRALLESAPDATVIVNQTGEIVLVNSQAEHIFGYNRGELIGKPVELLIPQSSRSRHAGHRSSYTEHPRVRMMGTGLELYALRKDGSQFPVEISLSPIETDEGMLVASSVRDISERKRFEEALRDSEAQFKSAFDYATIGMALVSLDGHWMKVNRAVCDLVGYSEAELLSKTFQDITHPDDLDVDINYVRQMLLGEIETYQMEKRYFHKDGHLVWVLLSVSLVRNSQQQPLHFISQIQNITARKYAEQRLLANLAEGQHFQECLKSLHQIGLELTTINDLDEFYRQAVKLGLERLSFERLGLLLYDPHNPQVMGTYGTDKNGRVIAEHQLRINADDLTGILKRAFESETRFVVDEQAELFSNFEPIGSGWNAVAILWNGQEKLGWLTADNGVHHAPLHQSQLHILMLYALTLGTLLAKKRTENALAYERDMLRTLIDSTPDYIFIKDREGRFILSNVTHAQAVRLTPAELLGKTAFDVFPPEFAARFHDDDEQIMHVGEPLVNIERKTVDASGDERIVLTTKIPLRDKAGVVTALVGISRDITTRKQLEAQTIELAAERDRVKVLQRFIHDMSHDFRTPLTVISSSLYLLQKNTDVQRRQVYVQRMEQQILRIDKLLEELLQMEHLDTGMAAFQFSETEVNGFLRSIVDDYRPLSTEKQIALDFSPAADSCFAMIDVVEFGRVITKLLDNAINYTPQGGHITVRSRTADQSVIISVEDNGIGIAPKDVPHIFERFYRADAARSTETGGSGLGLSIVQMVVEAHKGTIEVESTVGQGSTFTIKLPLH